MSTLHFNSQGEPGAVCEEGRAERGTRPRKLPSVEKFKLNNIIADVEDSKGLRHSLSESLLVVNGNYTADLDEQFGAIRSIEQAEVSERFDGIERLYGELGSVAQQQKEHRQSVLQRMRTQMQQANEQLAASKSRIDALIAQLKVCERRLPKKERLFDLDTANDDHYRELYEYGMEKEMAAAAAAAAAAAEAEAEAQRRRDSTSPTKIAQYKYLERELEDLSQQQQPFKNPTNVAMASNSESPRASVSVDTAPVTVSAAVSTTPQSEWMDEFEKIAKPLARPLDKPNDAKRPSVGSRFLYK